MEEKKTPPAPKRVKKPNIFVRAAALAATGGLILGALALVVYRDRFNLDAFKRWMTYRNMQTSATGEAAPFTHAGGGKLSVAYLEGGIVTASTAGAHYYGLNGERLAEEVLSMENPVLEASRTTGVVYDAGNQSLFAFRNSEEFFSLTLSGGAALRGRSPSTTAWGKRSSKSACPPPSRWTPPSPPTASRWRWLPWARRRAAFSAACSSSG